MARSLAQLKHLQISRCQKMEAIVLIEKFDEVIEDNFFCQLQHLELKDLPNLIKFVSRNFSELSNLSPERLQSEDFIKRDSICEEIEESDSTGNTDIVMQHYLFDKKVQFPNLKTLSIDGLAKLTTIWNNQFSIESSKNLEEIEIALCDNLISIFPASVARSLQQLRSLVIMFCKSLRMVFEFGGIVVQERHDTSTECVNLNLVHIQDCENLKNIFPTSVARNLQQLTTLRVGASGVEEIIRRDEELQTPPKFVFPKVTDVSFYGLSQLKYFYPGMHVSSWPSLVQLRVHSCGVNILAEDISSFQGHDESKHLDSPISQALFLIEKDSFPNLKQLALEDTGIRKGPLGVQLFSKLEVLCWDDRRSTSAFFLEGNSSCISAVGIGTPHQQQWHLPHLKYLKLFGKNLKHLGQEDEDNSQSVPRIPNNPNLKVLEVNSCPRLRNLRSPAISFNKLTSLEVTYCYGLKYLITYSMTKSLMHLTKLKIWHCLRLVEIVGGDEDEDSRHEITFRGLKHLNLYCLPKLHSFCSGNCIPKFPSLETAEISKRLELKIFTTHDQTIELANENEDTDVDYNEKRLEMNAESDSEETD